VRFLWTLLALAFLLSGCRPADPVALRPLDLSSYHLAFQAEFDEPALRFYDLNALLATGQPPLFAHSERTYPAGETVLQTTADPAQGWLGRGEVYLPLDRLIAAAQAGQPALAADDVFNVGIGADYLPGNGVSAQDAQASLNLEPWFTLPGQDEPPGFVPYAVQNGVLHLRILPLAPQMSAAFAPVFPGKDVRGIRYVAGMLSTQAMYRTTYGYFEIRARIPAGHGIFSAFWLYSERPR